MTSQQQDARRTLVTTPGDRDIHIERIFDAPRDRVFATYTDPELIPEWWGPRRTTTTDRGPIMARPRSLVGPSSGPHRSTPIRTRHRRMVPMRS